MLARLWVLIGGQSPWVYAVNNSQLWESRHAELAQASPVAMMLMPPKTAAPNGKAAHCVHNPCAVGAYSRAPNALGSVADMGQAAQIEGCKESN